jgi:glycerol kinase
MSKYVAAIDQGTTSTRCILFDHRGHPASIGQKEHAQIYPQPGYVEHDPLEIWACTCDVVRGALSKIQATASDITSIGITNQRETTLVWNKETGKPYHNALVWQDTRTESICQRLAADGGQDRFRAITGLPLATYFSGPKLMWLLENIPDLREDAEKGLTLFGTIDTWLIWNLTGGTTGGVHITDVTNASRTLLMNLHTLNWDEDILHSMGIPRQMLPQIRPSSDPGIYGMTESHGVFGGNIPVTGALGDQQAALCGQTCFDPGEAKNTYGTGCFMLLNTGEIPIQSQSGLLTTLAYQFDDQKPVYALEGSIAIAGALVQWLRDNLGLIEHSADIEALATSVPDNGGVYIVPAFSGLFAPYWRGDARGVITGLTRYATKAHLARAALEATAYQTHEVLDAMHRDSGVTLSTLKVDGGMVHNNLLMQFQSDILNVPVIRPLVTETTALGAAYASGLASGFWDNTVSLRDNWEIDRQWQPHMPEADRTAGYKQWLKAVERSFNWIES